MIERIKIAVGSCTLFLVIGAAIATHAQWLGVLIPSAILVWYGVVAQVQRDAKAVRKPARIGLH
jgi:hypothetical protein